MDSDIKQKLFGIASNAIKKNSKIASANGNISLKRVLLQRYLWDNVRHNILSEKLEIEFFKYVRNNCIFDKNIPKETELNKQIHIKILPPKSKLYMCVSILI